MTTRRTSLKLAVGYCVAALATSQALAGCGGSEQADGARNRATEGVAQAPDTTRLAAQEETRATPTQGGGAAVTTSHQLSADAAMRAAEAALARCIGDGNRVSVAVVDRSGLERATIRGDGAGPHTYESAVQKAFTAASFATPTSELQQQTQEPQASALRDIPGVLMLGGGLPIRSGDEPVAGIGVAGAPGGDLDEACAQAGIDAIAGDLR
jgi:uncharacterized protein GlcG (DUF336 family)